LKAAALRTEGCGAGLALVEICFVIAGQGIAHLMEQTADGIGRIADAEPPPSRRARLRSCFLSLRCPAKWILFSASLR
jgi:hypothetical protein